MEAKYFVFQVPTAGVESGPRSRERVYQVGAYEASFMLCHLCSSAL